LEYWILSTARGRSADVADASPDDSRDSILDRGRTVAEPGLGSE